MPAEIRSFTIRQNCQSRSGSLPCVAAISASPGCITGAAPAASRARSSLAGDSSCGPMSHGIACREPGAAVSVQLFSQLSASRKNCLPVAMSPSAVWSTMAWHQRHVPSGSNSSGAPQLGHFGAVRFSAAEGSAGGSDMAGTISRRSVLGRWPGRHRALSGPGARMTSCPRGPPTSTTCPIRCRGSCCSSATRSCSSTGRCARVAAAARRGDPATGRDRAGGQRDRGAGAARAARAVAVRRRPDVRDPGGAGRPHRRGRRAHALPRRRRRRHDRGAPARRRGEGEGGARSGPQGQRARARRAAS